MAVRQTQSRPKALNPNLPLDRQVRELERMFIQLWDVSNEMNTNVQKLLDAVDTDYDTDRLLNLITNTHGHSSEMPDKGGNNADHDGRYYSKHDAREALRRHLPVLTTKGERMTDSDGRTIIIDTHDD